MDTNKNSQSYFCLMWVMFFNKGNKAFVFA